MNNQGKKSSHSSGLRNRLKLFWLPIAAVCFSIAWFSQWRYNPEKEAKISFTRLNYWRAQANLPPLQWSNTLAQAANNHARYLSKNADGHEELNRGNPHFTGHTPQDRANYVHYHAPITENLTISNWARSGRSGVDGLMTALYHRLALLNPNHDEGGAAWVRGKNQALVLEQGSSQDRALCQQPHQQTQARYALSMVCGKQLVHIELNTLPQEFVGNVKFPIGRHIDPIYDGREQPNPMPNYRETGNPISIAFYGQQDKIHMTAFELHAPDGPIKQTKILTAENDPNRVLQNTQFALFPIKPLNFDTEYRVVFRYRQKGQNKEETWSFTTRKKRSWLEF